MCKNRASGQRAPFEPLVVQRAKTPTARRWTSHTVFTSEQNPNGWLRCLFKIHVLTGMTQHIDDPSWDESLLLQLPANKTSMI